MKRCLITGGCGFIGKNLCEAIKSEYEIIILDRCKSNIEKSSQFKLIIGDFGDSKLLDVVLKDVDYVFHLACTTIPQTSNENPIYDIQSNIIGTVNLLKKCVEHNVKKIIFLSSGGTVYGIPKKIPIKEHHLANPIGFHGIMKLTIEKYIQIFNYIYKLDYLILRPSNVYGKGYNFVKPLGAVNIFLWNIINDSPITLWGDGSIIRDYIWINDLIKAIIIGVKTNSKNRIYNIGSGIGISLNDLILLIEAITEKKAKVFYESNRAIDVPINVLDTTLAQDDLKWKSEMKIEEGIKLLFNFYKDQNYT